jgi:hypothetical protein
LAQIDGLISCNGANGSGSGGGGGSGGTIELSCSTLAGTGTIRANGGAGVDSTGGGGGGGVITIGRGTDQFAGAITAYGGSGANYGGTGPIILSGLGQLTAQYILDAGGNPTNTPTLLTSSIISGGAPSLILRNGAIGMVGVVSTGPFGSALISSNCWLLVSNYGVPTAITINFASLTVQKGGGILADGFGGGPGAGQGAGHYSTLSPYYPSGGGAHGGNGGNSISNLALGGLPYDNQTTPIYSGSGGGVYIYFNSGSGGGSITFTVTGLLQVDGIISANGINGGGTGGGGGAGGTIKLTAGALAGSGTIRANGGNGASGIGGGGGGGIIALYPTTNLFTGAITVTGGGGANPGGAGSVYTQQTGQTPQLVLDNGGQPGGPTQIQPITSTATLILRNGAMGYLTAQSETFANLIVSPNAFLIANSNSGAINLTLTGNATIQSGGGIIADFAGSNPSTGGAGMGGSSGLSPFLPSGGGGYGGVGGSGGIGNTNAAVGGSVYGSVTSPSGPGGSGGGRVNPSVGGPGGGSIQLTVSGTLNNSGRISANGGNGTGAGGGGGAGGSILLSGGTLTGSGTITANGGNGVDSIGGGGGGGRIAINYSANDFIGTTVARGGSGYQFGGAGTIYTVRNFPATANVGQVLVDNGGAVGANTPLSRALGTPATSFALTIQNGGAVSPQPNTNFPTLSTLTIGSAGLLTGLSNLTLDVLVLNSALVAPGGVIAVDGKGYSQQIGPGAGQSSGVDGGGAGYGGTGGAALNAAGGVTYGSATQPVDFGSGGGRGYGTPIGGSAGGGALRLNVGGVLTVDGQISAEGQAGIQDNSGGGSGGSIWVTAGTLAGNGFVAADGGNGEPYGGGGGGGGRIALYSRMNAFFGSTSALGGAGDFFGGNGTIGISNTVIPLQIVSNTPSGVVTNGVNSAVVYFNVAPNPSTMNSSAFTLMTPNGAVSNGAMTVTMLTSWSYLLSFPLQTAVGNYALVANQNIMDLYAHPLSQPYTGTFTISLPVIQGTVTDTNGNPVAGVTIQNSAGFSPTITDPNGNYALGFLPGSTFTVTPSSGALLFAPPSISYTNITATLAGQNYVAATSFTPAVRALASDPANLALSWNAVAGVNYQIYCSSDMTNWVPWGGVVSGSGPTQVPVPITNCPCMFFSVQPSQ